MRHSFNRLTVARLCVAGGLISLSVICGCGNSGPKLDPKTQATVTGTITNEGKPIPADSGVFFSSKVTDTTAAGRIDDKGQFTARPADPKYGLKAGTYQVTVRPPGKKAVANSPSSAEYQQAMMNSSKVVKGADSEDGSALIPRAFQNVDTTPLVLELKPGTNTFPIDLAKLKTDGNPASGAPKPAP